MTRHLDSLSHNLERPSLHIAPPIKPSTALVARPHPRPTTAYLERKLSRLAFAHFTDRLILSNKIWAQNAVIVNLHHALLSSRAIARTNALDAFRDRVLLENVVWRQKETIRVLQKEKEGLKGGRVKSIVGMAKALAGKGRLIRKLEDEMRRSKSTPSRKDATGKELEKLRLAAEARVVQQELSNQMEEELRAQLVQTRQENVSLKGQVADYERLIDGLWKDLQKPKIDSPVA